MPASVDKSSLDAKSLRGEEVIGLFDLNASYPINRFLGGFLGILFELVNVKTVEMSSQKPTLNHKQVRLFYPNMSQSSGLVPRTLLAGSQTRKAPRDTPCPRGTSALGIQNIGEIHVTTCV